MKNSLMYHSRLFITLLALSAPFSFANEETYDDCASTAPLTEKNQLIDIVLQTGGSYNLLTNAAAYNDWPIMVADILDRVNSRELKVMPMPFGIELFRRACENLDTPTFTMTPKNSGDITVRIKTFGNLQPNLTVTTSEQYNSDTVYFLTREVERHVYEIQFSGNAKQTYEIKLNKDVRDRGLYSVEFFNNQSI